MTKRELSQAILEKIKSKHITPKPRWQFLLNDYAVWFFASFSVLLGSLAVAEIIFMMRHNDWGFYQQISGSITGFILASLPYFWIIFLLLFIGASYYNYRHTKMGYRHRFSVIMAASIILSIMGGEILYQAGIGQVVDEALGAKLPVYRHMMLPGLNIWSQPENGRLSGVILNIDEMKNFALLDPEEDIWYIATEGSKIAPQVLLKIGERIKIVGQQAEDNIFNAMDIIPFGLPGKGFFDQRMQKRCHEEPAPPLPGMNWQCNLEMGN